MKILAFVQARMNSSRLPGKVLLDLCGKPMIFQQIGRLEKAKMIDGIIVLTSTSKLDRILYEECIERGIKCFKGSLDNVLSRFYCAYERYKPDHIVRITGDCPLLDWTVVDLVIEHHLTNNSDYTSNALTPTYADGLDVEVFTADCLKKMESKAVSDIEREHVTYYCYTHQNEFKLLNVVNPIGDESMFRWTVDSKEDFKFVSSIYSALYPRNSEFNSRDIVNYLEINPELKNINHSALRNEGLSRSIEMEGES